MEVIWRKSQSGSRYGAFESSWLVRPCPRRFCRLRRRGSRNRSLAPSNGSVRRPGVGFSAEVMRSGPSHAPIVGRFYQAVDGSTRLETGPSLDDVRTIDIANVTTQRTYLFARGRGWFEHPMRLLTEYTPPQMSTEKVATFQRTTVEGFEALVRTAPDGRMQAVVPALNFFAADTVVPTGVRTLYHHITINAPIDRSLFELPPGVSATYNAEPSGIIEYGPDEAEVDANGKVKYRNAPPAGR